MDVEKEKETFDRREMVNNMWWCNGEHSRYVFQSD